MELKELGGTGVMVPEVGVGTWQYRGGIQPLRTGLALGASLSTRLKRTGPRRSSARR